jgi:hypothetical protein
VEAVIELIERLRLNHVPQSRQYPRATNRPYSADHADAARQQTT